MTGYAAREGASEGLAWSWDLRSVNARGLDVRLRLPEGLGALEPALRKALSARVARGAVTLTLRLSRDVGSGPGGVDPEALQGVLDSLALIQSRAQAQGVATRAPSTAEIFALKGVADTAEVSVAPDPEDLLADAAPLIDAFVAMRRSEGAALKVVLEGQLTRMAGLVEQAQDAAMARTEAQGARFTANVAAILESNDALDAARIAQEVAILAVKSDVMEEIDRLRAHADAARDLLAKGGPVGRKLDFLMQEFNREANTLCSKSGDPVLTAHGLDLKLTIDQMREQVQNLE